MQAHGCRLRGVPQGPRQKLTYMSADAMNQSGNDTRIDAFRQSVERLSIIQGQLHTLEVMLMRANELPQALARATHHMEHEMLIEEQNALGHPLRIRSRIIRLEMEQRQKIRAIREQLHAAVDSTIEHVTRAAGGTSAAQANPFTRRVIAELERYQSMRLSTESIMARLNLLESAWQAIDAALHYPEQA